MRLTRFRVTNFRSVENSGWVDVDDVTALIGVNESGKTNLLTPLWKLNPAMGGEIQPTSDYPKRNFGAIRRAPQDYCFITAEFETGSLAGELAKKAGVSTEEGSLMSVKRYFNGDYAVSFPLRQGSVDLDVSQVKELIATANSSLADAAPSRQDEKLKEAVLAKLSEMTESMAEPTLSAARASAFRQDMQSTIQERDKGTSSVYGPVIDLLEAMDSLNCEVIRSSGESKNTLVDMVVEALPTYLKNT